MRSGENLFRPKGIPLEEIVLLESWNQFQAMESKRFHQEEMEASGGENFLDEMSLYSNFDFPYNYEHEDGTEFGQLGYGGYLNLPSPQFGQDE
ncbi:MAG: hypothetical protein M3Q24_01175 [bacterium]|nr:hypothetical protein [bacterium]